ncbi:MAG: hypothetical protein AB7O32_20750 [Vicinamibacterales bacterium]
MPQTPRLLARTGPTRGAAAPAPGPASITGHEPPGAARRPREVEAA